MEISLAVSTKISRGIHSGISSGIPPEILHIFSVLPVKKFKKDFCRNSYRDFCRSFPLDNMDSDSHEFIQQISRYPNFLLSSFRNAFRKFLVLLQTYFLDFFLRSQTKVFFNELLQEFFLDCFFSGIHERFLHDFFQWF